MRTRISGLGLIRLRIGGKYVLLVNKGYQARGRTTLSPVGGGLEYTLAGREHLLDLGATLFEAGNDLRFVVPTSQVEAATKWFQRRDPGHREIDAWREFREELMHEHPVLRPSDLAGATMRLAGFTFFHEDTPKAVPVQYTRYLVETFDVTLPEATERKLVAAAQGPDPVLYLVTESEILAGRTADGVTISASLCQNAFDLRAA